MVEKASLVVDRHHREEEIPVWIADEAGGNERGDTRHHAFAFGTGYGTHCNVVECEIGFVRFDHRRFLRLHVRDLVRKVELGAAGCLKRSSMQDTQVGGVNESLDHLDEIAAHRGVDVQPIRGRNVKEGPLRKWRRLLRGSQVDPNITPSLAYRKGACPEALFEARIRHVWCFHHRAVNRILPAVIEAANAVVFYPAERQGRAAMTAKLIENSDPAVRVSESDEAFAQKLHASRVTVGMR